MVSEVKREITVVEVIRKTYLISKYLLSNWLPIFLVAVLFGLAGILYAWIQKPNYIAEMSFTTEIEGSSKLGGYAGIAAQFGIDLGGGNNNIFEGENLAELLKSRRLVESTLLAPSGNGSKLLIDNYLEFTEARKGWSKDEKFANILFSTDRTHNTRIQDSILGSISVGIIKDQLQVFKKDKKLSIITAKMQSGDEYFSKRFIELLAANAIKFYTEYKSKRALQNVQILQKQTDSVRALLFGGISAVATMNDLNVNPIKQSVRIPSQNRQIDVQVNSALYTELLKNLELAKLTLRRETPLIQVIDTPVLPLEKKKPGRLFTGIIFAFIGGCLAIAVLLGKAFLKSQFQNKNVSEV